MATESTLYTEIEQCKWNNVLSLVHQTPKAVSTKSSVDGKGSLALHEACMREPPVLIISSLIAVFPEAVSTPVDGYLPLHLALKYGACADVIEVLVATYSDATGITDSKGNKPIDILHQNKSAKWSDETREAILKVLETGKVEFHSDSKVVHANEKPLTKDKTESKEREQSTMLDQEDWKKSGLVVVVIGASGDLAKKKTYPSLLHLYEAKLLPEDTVIWGFARSNLSHDELRNRLKPYLNEKFSDEIINSFLSKCYYKQGSSYGDAQAFKDLTTTVSEYEGRFPNKMAHNRLFYFAIPPNVFAETGVAIKENAMADKGWTRIIIEKPFGRDLGSCEEILSILAKNFDEEHLYRIDHYLGKEMVQNLLVLRFGNLWFDRIWNRDSVQCVFLTFKENFGTDGRGGYFDQYGIIRDIIQNHLLQVLTLLAMEPPTKADGPKSGESIRDAKVKVLESMPPVTIEDCVLGQYEGYTDDETIKNKNTNTPTYAMIRCFVHTPRWAGVPFIFKAGKALNERKAEMRIQFKSAPASKFLFNEDCPRNELVIRMQPDEAIYFKTNVKTPGFSSKPIQSELEVNYDTKYFSGSSQSNPDAYTRLILDVLRGRSAAFVREDELRRSWEIFTPLLHKIENENIRPLPYKFGSRGPVSADKFVKEKSGYIRNEAYVFLRDGGVVKKSDVVESDDTEKEGCGENVFSHLLEYAKSS